MPRFAHRIQFLIYSDAYREVQTKIDAVWQSARTLLQHFDKNWLPECRVFKPKSEEWHGYEEAMEKHVFAMYQMAIDKSCLPDHDLILKETSIKGRLDFLPEVLSLKVDIHTAFSAKQAPFHANGKQQMRTMPKCYSTVLTLEYYMKDLLHREYVI